MSEWTVDRAAGVLLEAEATGTDRPPITDEWPGLNLATAYAVQDETLRRRLDRGERLVGVKLGLTSPTWSRTTRPRAASSPGRWRRHPRRWISASRRAWSS